MVRGSADADGSELGFTRRVRRRLRVRAEKVLDRLGLVEPRPEPVPDTMAWPEAAATIEAPAPSPEPVVASVETAEEPPTGSMTFEAVQEVFDDMVRPALQSDGGDITLREVVDGEVRVTLVGACSTCPSAIVTMREGIQRLLEEEFEDFVALVQVEG